MHVYDERRMNVFREWVCDDTREYMITRAVRMKTKNKDVLKILNACT